MSNIISEYYQAQKGAADAKWKTIQVYHTRAAKLGGDLAANPV